MDVHEFAASMTEKEANNVIFYWEQQCTEKFERFQRLMKLGDSKQLATATVMMSQAHDSTMYQQAHLI